MPPRNARSVGSTSSTGSALDSARRELVGSTNVSESTLLEKCVNDQSCNQCQIDDIAERISALIRRLQGTAVGAGSEDESGEMLSIGLLGEHQNALKLEGRRLGEIQCDLAILESLL